LPAPGSAVPEVAAPGGLHLSQGLWGWRLWLDLRKRLDLRKKERVCRRDVLRQKIIHCRGVLGVLDNDIYVPVPVPVCVPVVGGGDGGGIGDVVGLHIDPESLEITGKKVGNVGCRKLYTKSAF
jgi:hypothetical protein